MGEYALLTNLYPTFDLYANAYAEYNKSYYTTYFIVFLRGLKIIIIVINDKMYFQIIIS